MITEELIKTKVGTACSRLGQAIANAYDWASTGLTEQQILDEIDVIDSEVEPEPSAVDFLEDEYLPSVAYKPAGLTQILNYKLAYGLNSIPLGPKATAIESWLLDQYGIAQGGSTNFTKPQYSHREVVNEMKEGLGL